MQAPSFPQNEKRLNSPVSVTVNLLLHAGKDHSQQRSLVLIGNSNFSHDSHLNFNQVVLITATVIFVCLLFISVVVRYIFRNTVIIKTILLSQIWYRKSLKLKCRGNIALELSLFSTDKDQPLSCLPRQVRIVKTEFFYRFSHLEVNTKSYLPRKKGIKRGVLICAHI